MLLVLELNLEVWLASCLLQSCILNYFCKRRKQQKLSAEKVCLNLKSSWKGILEHRVIDKREILTFRRSKPTNPGSPELRCTALLTLKARSDEYVRIWKFAELEYMLSTLSYTGRNEGSRFQTNSGVSTYDHNPWSYWPLTKRWYLTRNLILLLGAAAHQPCQGWTMKNLMLLCFQRLSEVNLGSPTLDYIQKEI